MEENEVSSTAFSVAQGVLLTDRRKQFKGLVKAEEKSFYTSVLNSTPEGRKKYNQVNGAVYRVFFPFMEKLLMPGLAAHYVLRKHTIEGFVENAISGGATQVVNLGAGFDSLFSRLAPAHSKVHFIEMDHPATQRVKKEAIEKMADESGTKLTNFSLVPIDFTKDTLKEKLTSYKGYDPKLRTVFIVEGVLMYLTPEEIGVLLTSVKELSKNGCHFIFTFVRPKEEGKHNYGPLLPLYLKLKSEPLNWTSKKESIEEFMSSHGFTLNNVLKSDDTFKVEMPNAATQVIHDGELIADAEYNWK
ncbi:MAG: class I SAM-dependent methyltransferase [Leptospirales bacterium]